MLSVFNRGDVIRKLRETQKWTQQQLAKRAGIHVSSVQRAEENHPAVTLDTLAHIAGALNVGVDFLSQAAADVTSPVNPSRQAPPSPSQEGGTPMISTVARLIHLVSSLEEAEAALLLPLVRQWMAQITDGKRKQTPR